MIPFILPLDNMMFISDQNHYHVSFDVYVHIDIYTLMKDHIYVLIEILDTLLKTFWRKSLLMHKLHLY